MIKKFKTTDNVIVITGKHKGQSGVIKKINNINNRVFIEGLNMQACFSKQKKNKMAK